MKGIHKILFYLVNLRYYMLYRKYRKYTMTPSLQFIYNMLLVNRYKNINGCVVECGVWKGGMIASMADILKNNRAYFIFDSFEGLPPAKDIDGIAAKKWQTDTTSEWYYDNCSADENFAIEAMETANCKDYTIKKGWFENTLPHFDDTSKIAILRLDGDWYDSTMTCLVNLFDKVNTGGLIIIDDYNTWEGCKKAVDDFLLKNKRPEKVLQFKNSIGYLIKQ